MCKDKDGATREVMRSVLVNYRLRKCKTVRGWKIYAETEYVYELKN